MKLINKDALVVEIERIKKEECPTDSYEGRCKLLWFEQFLSFLDSIETKEINLTLEAVVMPSDSSFWVNRDELSDFEDGDDVDILIIKK